MALSYLIDTDICIYFLKGTSSNLTRNLNKMLVGDVGISIVTYGELIFSAEKSIQKNKNLFVLSELIKIIPPIEMKPDVAEYYGVIRSQLEKEGRPIGSNDLWIAAHAVSSNLTLITNNTKEFSRIPQLTIENWMQEEPISV